MRHTLFVKVIGLVLLSMVPLLLIYTYSNFTNENVIEQEITHARLQNLTFLLKQMENNANQLKMAAITLAGDSDISKLNYMNDMNAYDKMKLTNEIRDKMLINSITSNWNNELIVYSIESLQAVSTEMNFAFPFKQQALSTLESKWVMVNTAENANADTAEYPAEESYFAGYIYDNYTEKFTENTKIVIEIRFSPKNLTKMLSEYKSGGKGKPFLIHPGKEPIYSSDKDHEFVGKIISEMQSAELASDGILRMKVAKEDYLVMYVRSSLLGWYMVDTVPLKETFAPIVYNKKIFTAAVVMILIICTMISFILYRQIQVPIKELLRNIQYIKSGSYDKRIQYMPNNEFRILNTRFNEMTDQIQMLIEKVLAEQVYSRDATLKQLQSQINPHFLYNCLFFIKNMSKMKKNEAIEAMALNLGEYFRYITRVDKPLAVLSEEVKLVDHYLQIHKLRLPRLSYEIRIPDEMLDLEVPKLMLQPAVENAIKHGLENKSGSGVILINGTIEQGACTMMIENNGAGLSDEQIIQLGQQLEMPMNEQMGYGLWNVYQRLIYQFGMSAGIKFGHSELGGLKVTIHWSNHSAISLSKEEDAHVSGISS